MPNSLSCIVHTRDSEKTLERALKSVSWVDELIVVDMQSSDSTLEIAAKYDATILHTEIAPRIDGVRNDFLGQATQPWTLVLDSDEYLAEDAPENVQTILTEHGSDYDAFAIPRYNYLDGVPLMGAGRYPDYQTRLFRSGMVRWQDSNHNPPQVISGPARLMRLTPPGCLHIHHPNYQNLQEFIAKQVEYALNDTYPADPHDFQFSDYIARAHEQLAMRSEPEKDGDISHALAVVMAWDSVIRGLIHWDQLEPKPALAYLDALPAGAAKIPWAKLAARKMLGRHLPWKHLLAAIRHRLQRLIGGLRAKKQSGRE